MVGSVGHLNPLFETEANDRDLDALIYQGLVTIDAGQHPVPLLASGWTESADHLQYIFTIRKGVKWADGVPFTVKDVMFTFGVLQNPAYTQASGQDWKQVTISQPSPAAVEFTLKAPLASFPLALRQGIIPEHIFSSVSIAAIATDVHSNGAAFGTGPFKVESIAAHGQVVRLVRNRNAQKPPHLGSFTFHGYPSWADAVSAVSRGDADAVGALAPPQLSSLVGRPDLSTYNRGSFSFAVVLFNLAPGHAGVLGDVAVRSAINKSIDRDAIIKEVLAGRALAAPGPIPPSDWAYSVASAKVNSYNPTGAKQDLVAAGWTPDPTTSWLTKSGQILSLNLVTADGYPYLQVANALAGQLKKVGVKVDVQTVAASDLVSRYLETNQYQMALAAFDNGPDPDQYGLWHSGAPPGSLNFASSLIAKQDLIDKDLEDGRAASWNDRSRRAAIYADFQTLIGQAVPAIFLYEPRYTYVVSRRVKGVRIDPAIDPPERFAHISDWYVNSA